MELLSFCGYFMAIFVVGPLRSPEDGLGLERARRSERGKKMADTLSAYGADESVVNWTILSNTSLLAVSFLTYGFINSSSR